LGADRRKHRRQGDSGEDVPAACTDADVQILAPRGPVLVRYSGQDSMRKHWLLISIWVCFLLRGWFYASMLPLWEGYDEFAHFGVIRAMARGIMVPPRDQRGPRDVEESLRLAAVPWEVRNWDVFRSSLTQEQYWALPAEEKRDREARLRTLPEAWAREESTAGISAYEALQPPLSYWLMAPVVRVLRNSGLLAQVMAVRWLGVILASFAVPLTFAIVRSVVRSDAAGLGCAAVVALMPGLATDVARVSNEPLSILLFSLLVWAGLRILEEPERAGGAGLLGAILGLGLLTKAYFLTAIPAVALLLLRRHWGDWRPWAATFGVPAGIAGWWYVRNLVTTGTISGLAEPILLRDRGVSGMIGAIPAIPWLKAVDVILVSHLYFCGWSSLTVRSWMYHAFYVVIALVLLGLVRHVRRPPVAWLAAVYAAFWLGQLYNVVLQYLTKGLPGSMGWYLYAVVTCEVALCAVAFGRWRGWGLAGGAVLFGLLDLYGMHGLAIPYYTGLIGHKATGALATVHLDDFLSVGFAGVFERLAVNKTAALSPWRLTVLWVLYLGATVLPMAAAVGLTRERSSSTLRHRSTD